MRGDRCENRVSRGASSKPKFFTRYVDTFVNIFPLIAHKTYSAHGSSHHPFPYKDLVETQKSDPVRSQAFMEAFVSQMLGWFEESRSVRSWLLAILVCQRDPSEPGVDRTAYD